MQVWRRDEKEEAIDATHCENQRAHLSTSLALRLFRFLALPSSLGARAPIIAGRFGS